MLNYQLNRVTDIKANFEKIKISNYYSIFIFYLKNQCLSKKFIQILKLFNDLLKN